MADEIKTLDDLKDVVTEDIGGVQGAAEDEAISREPQRDELGRSYATGKRKDAVARVWIKPGLGCEIWGIYIPYFQRTEITHYIGFQCA